MCQNHKGYPTIEYNLLLPSFLCTCCSSLYKQKQRVKRMDGWMILILFRCLFLCRSWQTLKFDKQPASFIRIVGTHNTANEVRTAHYCHQCSPFHLKHQEHSESANLRQGRICLSNLPPGVRLVSVAGVPLCSLRVSGPAGDGGERRQSGARILRFWGCLPAAATPATITHTQPATHAALFLLAIFLLAIFLTDPPLREPHVLVEGVRRETSECHFAQPSSSRLHCYRLLKAIVSL